MVRTDVVQRPLGHFKVLLALKLAFEKHLRFQNVVLEISNCCPTVNGHVARQWPWPKLLEDVVGR